MRKKISIGFLSLAVLLFFAGGISIYELSRARTKAGEIIEQGTHSASLAKRMLEALQMQNTSIIKMIASDDAVPGEEFAAGTAKFDQILAEAAGTIHDPDELAPIYAAKQNFQNVIAGYANEDLELDVVWFANTYLDAFYDLYASIRDYLSAPHASLSERTEQLEKSAYKTITPSILTLLVAILIVLMLYFFVDIYYVKPMVKINKGLKSYMTAKVPFDDSFEANDELTELKESITELIEQTRR